MMKQMFRKLYRLVFRRGGYGVNSPFVFDLITKVIEERCAYYCYETLHVVRIQLLQKGRGLLFSKSEGELLFRLANRFGPKRILSVGGDSGLLPLCLTAYSESARCVTLESSEDAADYAKEMVDKYARSPIEIRCGEIGDLLTEILGKPANSHFDFVVWADRAAIFTVEIFERLLPHLGDEGVLAIAGISAGPAAAKTWRAVCAHPKTTVAIDLVDIGIAFFNPKLHKKTYKSVVI